MKNKLIIRIIGIVFLIILVWRIILLVVQDKSRVTQPARPPVAVVVDSASYEPIQEIRQLTGSIYPLYQYIVAPKIAGRITSITKRIGNWVNHGEVIAKIDDAEYQQAVLEAEANLKISDANLNESRSQFELARQELERIQSLQQKGIASPSELDAATTNFDALQSRIRLAQAQVEQRQAALNSAKIRLSYTVLRATEPGFIGERYVDEGGLLAPNSPVLLVIGIDTVIVRTTVIERVYGLIKLGQAAEIEVDAFPGKRFYGKVSRIAPMLQEASRVAQMEVEVANDSLLLKPGMFSKVNVVLAAKDSAQVVPTQAVVTRDGVEGVFLIKAGETVAHYLPVQAGIRTADKTEIITPQIDGFVVTLGQHLLEDGSGIILSK
ncbi:efflux RND transporter periplasmic adaptor subunit [candidate division KSB1 bacterium]|nr:efflux RND transporter periplasmic adaptor subunit [candidate division KSB1 bacterium]